MSDSNEVGFEFQFQIHNEIARRVEATRARIDAYAQSKLDSADASGAKTCYSHLIEMSNRLQVLEQQAALPTQFSKLMSVQAELYESLYELNKYLDNLNRERTNRWE